MIQEIEIVEKVLPLIHIKKRHKIIVGGRGKGASWSIARILLLEGMKGNLFIPCVREVQKTIKYSVKKLLEDTIKMLELQWFYKATATEVIGKNGTKFVFFGMQEYNADNVKSLEGADRCWVAEAQSISRRSINILRPTIRKEKSVLWWDFNPRYETDPVYVDYIINNDINAEVLWLNWKDNPWFTGALKQELESDYSRNKEEAEHIWEGKLRNAADKFVCPSSLTDIAIKNNITRLDGTLGVGADIAHQGGDRIIFYKRHGRKIIDKYVSQYQATGKTVQDLKAFTGDKSIVITIDNGYIGASVADYLEDDGYLVNRVDFGGTAKDDAHYYDVATEMYFNLRDILETIDIPNDEELRNELIQRKYDFIKGRKGYEVMKIESKDDYKKHARINYKSPDKADALVLTFYEGIVEKGFAETLPYSIF